MPGGERAPRAAEARPPLLLLLLPPPPPRRRRRRHCPPARTDTTTATADIAVYTGHKRVHPCRRAVGSSSSARAHRDERERARASQYVRGTNNCCRWEAPASAVPRANGRRSSSRARRLEIASPLPRARGGGARREREMGAGRLIFHAGIFWGTHLRFVYYFPAQNENNIEGGPSLPGGRVTARLPRGERRMARGTHAHARAPPPGGLCALAPRARTDEHTLDTTRGGRRAWGERNGSRASRCGGGGLQCGERLRFIR